MAKVIPIDRLEGVTKEAMESYRKARDQCLTMIQTVYDMNDRNLVFTCLFNIVVNQLRELSREEFLEVMAEAFDQIKKEENK